MHETRPLAHIQHPSDFTKGLLFITSYIMFQNGVLKKKAKRPFVESFEKIPLLTAATTFVGFYLMLLMGYVSSLVFTPKVAREKNRKVRRYSYFIESPLD